MTDATIMHVVDYGQWCTCPHGYCYIHGSTSKWTWPMQTITITSPTTTQALTQKGWECPRCTRINSPSTPFCCKEPGK